MFLPSLVHTECVHTFGQGVFCVYNKVEICGVNTAKLAVLTAEEKKELLQKCKQGDMDAREKLINGNLRLVLSVIQKFNSRGENPDDLFQIGCIGLMKAIDNFDITQEVRFSTYAVPMIIGEVRRYLRDNNLVRVSRSVRDLAYKALGEKEQLAVTLGREPTVDEITAAVNRALPPETMPKEGSFSKKDIAAALDAVLDPVSLYEPVYADGGDSVYIMDQVCDKKNNDEIWTESIALNQAMAKLVKREKDILTLRFYSGRTQMEVASEIGISQAQVSRLEKGALEKLKKQIVTSD